ncbi:M28 family metallopeptidase [Bacteriovoracaceae bacterium]|nr:M28 family metallopeptidase [Bacteriovoracaceae bacterium]
MTIFMKNLCILFLLSSNLLYSKSEQLYLVTTRDPHYLPHILDKVNIHQQNGRTLIVTRQNQRKLLPHFEKYLKKIDLGEVNNYSPLNLTSLHPQKYIQKILDGIKPKHLQEKVEKLSSFPNRRAGHQDNRLATSWVAKEFSRLGYKVDVDCFKRNTCNVYAHMKGQQNPDEIILVEAHLDSVGKKGAGADDNASGTGALLVIAKAVLKAKLKRSYIFFATNGEEQGLLGAKHYVKRLKAEGKLKKIKFVINMDMIAYNKKDKKVDLETNKQFEKEARWMAKVVQTYTELTPNIVTPAWGSDHVPFLNEKIPTILTIEHWPNKTPCYHASCDKPGHLIYDYAIEIVKLNVASAILKNNQ